MDPLVTVITLSFNSADRIQNTLNTIRGQTYLNIEHIIIDDASTDNSVAVINDWITSYKYECRFIVHSQNKGICASLNEALRVANGDFIAIIGDDEMLPAKIEDDVSFMQAHPEIGLCHSNLIAVNEQTGAETLLKSHDSANAFHDFFAWNLTIYSPTAFYRKTIFDEIGLFDETLIFEDLDMLLRATYKFKVGYRDITTVRYMKGPKKASIGRVKEMTRQTIRIIQKWSFLEKYRYYRARRHLSLFYSLSEDLKWTSLRFIPASMRSLGDKRLYRAFLNLFFKW